VFIDQAKATGGANWQPPKSLVKLSRIFLAPFQRLTNDLVLIRAGEMPQKSLASFFVNERGKASAFWASPNVQLNHILAVVDAPLK
jgi:hypothetical protein